MGEPTDRPDGLSHQALRAGHLFLEVHRALAQRLVELPFVGVNLQRGAMSSFDRDHGLGEKSPRPLDDPRSGPGWAARRYQGRQGLPVNSHHYRAVVSTRLWGRTLPAGLE